MNINRRLREIDHPFQPITVTRVQKFAVCFPGKKKTNISNDFFFPSVKETTAFF